MAANGKWYEVRHHAGTIEDSSHNTRFWEYDRAKEVLDGAMEINPNLKLFIVEVTQTERIVERSR